MDGHSPLFLITVTVGICIEASLDTKLWRVQGDCFVAKWRS